MRIFFLVAVLFIAGCARTYHVYNFVGEGATMTQHIEVLADVPKTVTTDVGTEVGL